MLNAFEDRIIWSFWTGDNEMSDIRAGALEYLEEHCEADHRLITLDTLEDYILEDDPFHEGYQYLSLTHKSDYLRSYFLYHYGGGYADIKAYDFDWVPYFEELEVSDKDFIGSAEVHPEHIASDNFLVCNHFEKLATVRTLIFKPKTEFAKEWKKRTNEKMDEVLDQLKVQDGLYHPRATGAEPGLEAGVFGEYGDWPTGYPVVWNALLGKIIHQLQYENLGSFLLGMPNQLRINYR
jgi:hypothetical protein